MNAIVVGTDGSPGAEVAVQKVIELMSDTGATVHLVCAYPGRSPLERIGMTARQESVDLRGVGRALVGALEALARRRRCYGMYTLADDDNEAARATYGSAGGRETSRPLMIDWDLDGAD